MIKPNKVQSSVLFALFSFFLCFIFWMTLAPTQFGGWVTYVIVDGNSMEPGFYLGDLVLVRSQQNYGAGDAVVYYDPNMGSYVFHRIVRTELDRFILQGDNNSWLDSYQPTQDEVVGKLWVHLPKLGRGIEWMRVPLNMAVIAGLMGVVLMLDLFKNPSKSKKENRMPAFNFGGISQIGLYGSAFFALLFLVLGIYAFTRPLNLPTDNIPYQQEGNFYYSATGTPGVYDTDVVRSGEPVFPKLTCFLNIGLTYNVIGNDFQGIAGKQTIYARVLDETSGWHRTIPLTSETIFSGNSYFAMTTLDLCQIESIVNLVEQEAGLKQITYTLEIVADTSFTASVAGNQISDSFSPKLVFKYDKVHFYLAEGDSKTDPLFSTKAGLAGTSSSQRNAISLLGLEFPIWVIRFISLLGFGVSLISLIVLGSNLYKTASQNEQALIRLKYGGMLVDVYEQNLAPASSIIDVRTIDDLARLAEKQGTMILHMTRNFLHYYFVQNNSTTYRYVVSSGNQSLLAENIQPVNENVKQAEPVISEPVITSETIQTKLPEKPAEQKPRIIYTYVPPPEEIAPTYERKVADPKPALSEAVEYVINTGNIEFEMPLQEATVLPRIKL